MQSLVNGCTNLNYGNFPTYPSNSPEIRFNSVYVPQTATYRIWVCGYGGNGNNDTLHAGANNSLPLSSSSLEGFDANEWRWRSVRLTNQGGWWKPTIDMNSGEHPFNIWMREDGIQIGRVLLARDLNYVPINKIQCGPY